MQEPQPITVRPALPPPADRSLKIIINDWIIIRVSRYAAFLHQTVIRVSTAVIHIIADPIHSRRKSGKAHPVAIVFMNDRAAVLGDLVARAKLTGGIGKITKPGFIACLDLMQVSANFRFSFGSRYFKPIRRHERFSVLRPRSFRVAAKHR